MALVSYHGPEAAARHAPAHRGTDMRLMREGYLRGCLGLVMGRTAETVPRPCRQCRGTAGPTDPAPAAPVPRHFRRPVTLGGGGRLLRPAPLPGGGVVDAGGDPGLEPGPGRRVRPGPRDLLRRLPETVEPREGNAVPRRLAVAEFSLTSSAF